MLSIVLHTSSGGREVLDLLPGSVLSLESTSPLFDESLREGTWSLPIALPWTERNRRLLGAPEMLEGMLPAGDGPHWTIDVLNDGIPEYVAARMSLLTVTGDFSYTSGTYEMAVSGPESAFGGSIKGKSLRDLKLGGRISWNGDARHWATDVMNDVHPQHNYVRFAPIRWQDYIDTGRDDYLDEYLHNDTINQVVFDNDYPNGWVFGRPHPNNAFQETLAGQEEFKQHRTVPFLTLHFVLRAVFEEHGYVVYGDFLNDLDYSQLVVFNTRALEVYNSLDHDIINFMDPGEHVPDVLIGDFLAAVQNTFGFGFMPMGGNKIMIYYRTRALSSSQVRDVTAHTISEYTAERPDVAGGGYSIGWSWEGEDQLSEEVEKFDAEKVKRQVMTFNNLAALGNSFNPGDLVYVASENQYYEWQPAGGWAYRYTGQQELVVGKGDKRIEIQASTMIYDTSKDMCATRQPGTYVNNRRTLVKSDFGLRFFYVSKKAFNGAIHVPVSFSHNYDPQGNRRVQTSLSWTADESLYLRHHKAWYDKLLRTRVVKARFALPPGSDAISFERPLRIGSQHYLIEKLLPELGNGAPVEAQLVKI